MGNERDTVATFMLVFFPELSYQLFCLTDYNKNYVSNFSYKFYQKIIFEISTKMLTEILNVNSSILNRVTN